jgi:hypothetical protein
LTRPLLNEVVEFAVSRTNNVPEFSFAPASEGEICDAVMSIRSDAAGVDGIPLSFIKLLLPVILPVLTIIFNHMFVSSEFPGKWKTSVVHGLLLCKLRNFQKYSVGAGMLVGSYFGERAQFVRSGGQESSVGAVTCGFPQGSILGPFLFISNIDDVSRVIRYCRFHIYADDLRIYHTCAVSDFQKCIDELNLN